MHKFYFFIGLLSVHFVHAQSVSDQLFIHWPFNGNLQNEAGSLYDLSSANNLSVSFEAGHESLPNTAVACSATDAYITDSLQIDSGGNTWSVAVWVKPTQDAGGYIVGNKNFKIFPNFSAYENPGQFALAVLNDGRILFQVVDVADLAVNYFGDTLATFNEWNHLVAVFNNSNNSVQLYKNKQLIHSGTTVSVKSQASQLWVGGYRQQSLESNGTSTFTYEGLFNGSVDDIRIYTRALSAADVVSLFDLETPAPSAVLNTSNYTIDVYPNPAEKIAHWAGNKPYDVVLYTTAGQAVLKLQKATCISLENIPAGIYYVSFSTEGESGLAKLVVR